MSTTTPRYWSWFDIKEYGILEEGDVLAYELPDYPGPREGTGLYVDLFVDDAKTQPLARLWLAGNRLGLVHVPYEDDVWYAKVALTLRQLYSAGMAAEEAFYNTAGSYAAGPVFEGPLEDIADPAVQGNESI